MRLMKMVAIVGFAALSTQTLASPLVLYPVQTGEETARYKAGVPVLSIVTATGGLQVQPLPIDHGHIVFGLSVYNASGVAQNFGVENVHATVNGQDIPLLSLDQLEHQAKRRAGWSKFGTSMVTGLAAGLASTAHTTDTTYSSVYTRHGTYAVATTYNDYSIGAEAAGNILNSGARKIDTIQARLDARLNNLSGAVIRTTTLDPNAGYGGIIVLDTVSSDKLPQDIHLNIVWAGAVHPFTFRLTREGQNMPAVYTASQITPQAPQPMQQASQPVPQPSQPAPQATLTLASAPAPGISLDAPAQLPLWAQTPMPEPQPAPAPDLPAARLSEAAREQLAYDQGFALARAQLQASEIETAAKIRAWEQRQ